MGIRTKCKRISSIFQIKFIIIHNAAAKNAVFRTIWAVSVRNGAGGSEMFKNNSKYSS